MTPKFLYFDMGNVLLFFSHQRMAAQMAQAAGVAPERAWQILFEEGLEWAYERGELTQNEFHREFCTRAGTAPDPHALDDAASDIFKLNVPMVALLGQLARAGFPLGVLTNTSPSHWRYCTSRFGILTSLPRVSALSFQIGAIKPDGLAYERAADLAGVPAEAIFYTDDRPDNIAAARAAGWDGVLFQSVSQLNEELRARGVVINY